MPKHLSVTGTRRGMTPLQADMAAHLLAVCRTKYKFDVFHDGDCIGVDVEARSMAVEHGYYCCVHPSTAKTRAFCQLGDECRDPKHPLVRNRDIVDECELLLAFPREAQEVRRSGTWAAIRYARKVGRRTVIVLPDGSLLLETGGKKNG